MIGPTSRLALVVALAAGLACKDGQRERAGTGSGSTVRPGKIGETDQILVLEAALDNAKKELAQLVAATPQDERAIAEKRGAIDAVEQTLASLRRRGSK